jgi:hypothetical protein
MSKELTEKTKRAHEDRTSLQFVSDKQKGSKASRFDGHRALPGCEGELAQTVCRPMRGLRYQEQRPKALSHFDTYTWLIPQKHVRPRVTSTFQHTQS